MRKQRWRRMQGVAGVLLLPLAFSVSATTGNINPSTYSYSRAYGVTEREAAQRQSATVMAGQLERQLQTLHPDTFAGLYIEHMPDFRVVVKFTSTPAHTLQGFTTDLRYKAEIAPQSLEMMLAVQDEGDAQLRSAGIEFLSGIDIKRSMVTFHVKNVDSAARAMRHLLRAVDFVEILPTAGFVETTAISGGHRINGPAQDCTTGFNVFDADHELGVTTAGHCDNAVAYVGLSAPLVFQAENNQGDFDVQWHKEPSSGARQVQKNQIELVAGPTSTVDNHQHLGICFASCGRIHLQERICGPLHVRHDYRQELAFDPQQRDRQLHPRQQHDRRSNVSGRRQRRSGIRRQCSGGHRPRTRRTRNAIQE